MIRHHVVHGEVGAIVAMLKALGYKCVVVRGEEPTNCNKQSRKTKNRKKNNK